MLNIDTIYKERPVACSIRMKSNQHNDLETFDVAPH